MPFPDGHHKEYKMIDLLKKGFWMGLGAATIAKESVESVTRSLVRKGKLTAGEADKMTKELLEEAREDLEAIQNKGKKEIEKVLSEFQSVSKQEFEALKERVEALEARLKS
jgi:polyhydroxyalkanoate synthesis regulator phasin